MSNKQQPESQDLNFYSAPSAILNPNKMLVESATMIFIISFMMAMFVMLVWRGSELNSTQVLMGAFGLLFTFAIAVRQFASFR
jgi:hypothetical protein